MFSARELQNVWYGDRRPNLLLIVLSMLFAAVSASRRKLYASGVFSRKKLSVPVVVVGNITAGGAGKTPLVIALVDALRERGWKPGVFRADSRVRRAASCASMRIRTRRTSATKRN